jgi:hypothetical protein
MWVHGRREQRTPWPNKYIAFVVLEGIENRCRQIIEERRAHTHRKKEDC